jgi:hypothetical protein
MKWQLLLWLLLMGDVQEKKPVEIAVIGFYNLENLYDTINNPMVNDDEFTPDGAKHYSSEIYINKLFKLAYVLKEFGTDIHPRGAAIIGVAEIENDTVLNDLVTHFLLRNKKYHIVHFDSKDARGIDVGLLYQQDYFHPYYAKALEVILPGNSKEAFFTRDILYVKGKLSGEEIHIYVNHWPSRRGGEERSAPARAAAAKLCRTHADSIRKENPSAKIIVMGDLNDNPTDESIIKILGATDNRKKIQKDLFYTPWIEFYKKGMGTLANRDIWGLFDQILLSSNFLDTTSTQWKFIKAGIHHSPFMTENTGRYKGYPMRTWDGNIYRGGFSDHYPTYVVLQRL